MFVVALHIARASAAATPRLGRQRRLTWRPHAGRRLDADDIGQVQSTDTGTEVTVCTIARIGQDDTGGDTLRMGCADLIERDLRLGFEPDIFRHMCLFPPCRIICPCLRQIEPVSDRQACRMIGDRQRNRDLTIVLFAEPPTILSRDADRMRALLRKTGVIDDPGFDPPLSFDARQNQLADLLQNGLVRPGRLADQM